MGRPMPGYDVVLLDQDEREVARAKRGEICLRARSNPHYPLGYWRLTRRERGDIRGEWFHTKDAARMDEAGYIWYEGRSDDVIIAAGYRIGPFEVESACLEHRAVAEAAGPSPRRTSASRQRRQGVRRARRRLRARRRAGPTRSRGSSRERLSAYAYPRLVRVRRRVAQDADRQDPPRRAARARGAAARRRSPSGRSYRRPQRGAGRRWLLV